MAFKVPEKYRLKQYSSESDGNNGMFFIPKRSISMHGDLTVVASDGGGWEHVSVSKKAECPSWNEMCLIKETFWDDPEDWAIQYHVPLSKHVNNHSYCLHLWRPIDICEMPFPPDWMVGFKGLNNAL